MKLQKTFWKVVGALATFTTGAGLALAQATTTDQTGGGTTITPGVPTTGGGDITLNIVLLASAIVMAVLGVVLLERSRV